MAKFTFGPVYSVRTTRTPYDDAEQPMAWYDAYNLYNIEPNHPDGWAARSGFVLQFGGAVATGGTFRGQGVFNLTDPGSNVSDFFVMKGKLYRTDIAFAAATDVTPGGITIDSAVTTRVYGTAFGSQLIITDGVNRPWIATNLTSTPVTGAYIDFDGNGVAWSAFGPFWVYGGSVFCILQAVNGTSCQEDVGYSVAGDAATGYQQANYDYRWTIMQNGSGPLFALAATNTQLFYFRENSIGAFSGAVGPSLATTATHDAVSQNVGTLTPQSVVMFGDTIYFCDAIGRPYRFVPGAQLDPIWLQMKQIVDDTSGVGFPGITKHALTAAFEPFFNLYLVAIWSPVPSEDAPPTQMYAFRALDGKYLGRWQLAGGFQIDCLGTWIDANGRPTLVLLGSNALPGALPAASGFVWTLSGLIALGDYLAEENLTVLTEEDLTTILTTEGNTAQWTDSGNSFTREAITPNLLFSDDLIVTPSTVTALVGTSGACQVSLQTAANAVTLEGTPTPNPSQSGVNRLLCGIDGISGRGPQVTVAAANTDDQFSIQSISMEYATSTAGPEDS